MAEPVFIDCGMKVIAKLKEYCSEKDDSGQPCMTKAKLKEMVQNEFKGMITEPKNAAAVKELMKMADDVKDSKITMPVLCAFYGKLLIAMSKVPQDSTPVETVLPSCGRKMIAKFNKYCQGTDDQGRHYMSKDKLQEMVQDQFGERIKKPKNPDAAKDLLKKVEAIQGPMITLEIICPIYVAIMIDLSNG